MKKSFVFLTVLLTIGFVSATYGQPNAADPDLRFWLAADQLAGTHSHGDPVTTMTSMDSYATIMAPDLVGTGPGQTSSGPHIDLPPYYQVTSSGHSVLYFHRDGPAWDDYSSSRMWQMNNLGAGDPTDIGGPTGMTVYAVYQNIGANRGDGPVDVGPWNPVVVKRGTGSCVWQYGDNAADDLSGASPVHVTYDGITVYPAGDPKHQWSDWNLGKMTIEPDDGVAPNDNFINFWTDSGLTAGGTGMVAHANNGILQHQNRNASTPEPMGIATHSQDCCGHGETFAGAIAEIIIYANEMETAEAESIEAYLTQKYAGITPIPEPMTLSLLGLGGLALLRRKRS